VNKNIPFYIQKYLEKYSLRNWILEAEEKKSITAAVVVPAIKEYENIKILVSSLLENDSIYLERSLIIFVINNLASSRSEIKEENRKTINYIHSLMEDKNINIGLIDASSVGKEMPEKEGGVGFARKIGMDLTLTVFDYTCESKKILVSLDADCTVEKNYLSEIFRHFNSNNHQAAVLRYRHDLLGDNEHTAAIIFYEIFLRYYVLGLKFAGSRYAFHTIGSTITCDLESYIKVEGMNKRKAAEDFYFLQKLAKNFEIGRIYSTTVFPASRASWRVPFGTGVKVSQFKPAEENYVLYNPVLFRILKDWLHIFNNNNFSSPDQYLKSAEEISPLLKNFLIGQKFNKDFANILENSTTPVQLEKQKFRWFDGFRTLKLIHHLRDTAYPMINMFEALDNLMDLINYEDKPGYFREKIPPLDIQKEYLEILRSLDDKNLY
jgi:hypothetical protein